MSEARPIREAASVILLRESAGGFEVFLLRRNRGASFMASSHVFPGGATEPGEDARTAAARELFEEAGVLLAKDSGDASGETLELPSQERMRSRILAGTPSDAVLKLSGLMWSTEVLVPWAHWITPSIESKRFSARFFVTELPPGQVPQFDAAETVDQTWVTPQAALAQSKQLALPPPQLRTFWELSQLRSIAEVLAAAKQRADEPHPIMPRLAPSDHGPVLLLPWDRDYTVTGTGEATPLTYRPSWATGPSRFYQHDGGWKHVEA